jgi:hypothetical protein
MTWLREKTAGHRSTILLSIAAVVAAGMLYLAVDPFGGPGNPDIKQVRWSLPAGYSPSPASRTIKVSITGGVCGAEPDRLDHTDVHATSSRVAISAFLGSTPPYRNACPAVGIVLTKSVHLDKPLGRRTIIDTKDGEQRWPRLQRAVAR